MASKRYFFVHLALFLGICGSFALAGIASYQDQLRSEARSDLESRQAFGESEAARSLGVLAASTARALPR